MSDSKVMRVEIGPLMQLDGPAFKAAIFSLTRAHQTHRRVMRQAADKRRRMRHPELFRHYKALRKARERGATGSHTLAEWLAKLEASGHRCAYCGRADLPLCREHVVPIARGGTNAIANIVPACRPCNSRKGAR